MSVPLPVTTVTKGEITSVLEALKGQKVPLRAAKKLAAIAGETGRVVAAKGE